ncbi:type IV pilus modification PilV family protein [Aeoliella mucimassa]|uniref:Prepilin-type N-terminal cleavage/methylation domain-containing protein n=1 Tax=Aeoliella mucimassa TaxID=2527972 RepID=A0A518ART8_9BACT|nr:hypothetical protein [Aeoliella mucimassa]QDU57437.1 hypothetical protein Pan181_36530 [Aeoliella mucimassa]
MSAPFTHRAGTSLAEVVIATLLVGVLLIAALESAGSAALGTRNRASNVKSTLLAQELLAEVMSMPYQDPDPRANITFGLEADELSGPSERANFDDIDDYDGWSESPPTTRAGIPLDGYSGWQRSVVVVKHMYSHPATTLADGELDDGLRSITVNVEDPTGNVTSLTAFRTEQGALEQPTGLDRTIISNVTIAITSNGQTVRSGANIMNHCTD